MEQLWYFLLKMDQLLYLLLRNGPAVVFLIKRLGGQPPPTGKQNDPQSTPCCEHGDGMVLLFTGSMDGPKMLRGSDSVGAHKDRDPNPHDPCDC